MGLIYLYDMFFYNFMFMLLLLILIKYYNYLLLILIVFEFMIVFISFLIYKNFMNYNSEYFMIYFLVFSVCEGVIGLSLVINLMREYGDQQINSLILTMW